MARLLGRFGQLARRLNPRATKSVVVKLHPRRLARAVREFRRIGSADLARLARGVGRGAKGVGGRLGFISPRKARSVRVVTSALRELAQNVSPRVAARVARETTRLARTMIVKLDPRRVEDAVRRFVETIDLDGKRKVDSTRLDRMARAAVNKIGPDRAVRMAAEVTRALTLLVQRLDPDQVGDLIRELVEAAKSANDKKGRLRVVGFLASLGREIVRALKGVAEDVKFRDVVVVVLVVVATAPELLLAAGVSIAALRVLTLLLQVLVQVLPEPEGENGPESAPGTRQSGTGPPGRPERAQRPSGRVRGASGKLRAVGSPESDDRDLQRG